jgi:hypothetical protein
VLQEPANGFRQVQHVLVGVNQNARRRQLLECLAVRGGFTGAGWLRYGTPAHLGDGWKYRHAWQERRALRSLNRLIEVVL